VGDKLVGGLTPEKEAVMFGMLVAILLIAVFWSGVGAGRLVRGV